MADRVYLGIDLGAESGRVMAGVWNGKQLRLEEVHRFPNGGVFIADTLRWDVVRLWSEIQTGLGLAGKKYGASAIRKLVFVTMTWPPFDVTRMRFTSPPNNHAQSACVSSWPST